LVRLRRLLYHQKSSRRDLSHGALRIRFLCFHIPIYPNVLTRGPGAWGGRGLNLYKTAKLGHVPPLWALYIRLCCPPWPLGRLLAAILRCTIGTGCTVRADLGSKVAFGAPTCSLHSQNELQLALQLPFQSAQNLQKVW